MLKSTLLHPHILSALARAGHGSKVLISDGNYPHWTARGPNAEMVYLNLAPGLVGCCDVLKVLSGVIPIEAAAVMAVNRDGPYVLPEDPAIWADFRTLLKETDSKGELEQIERFQFYRDAGTPEVCLTVATGEQRIYANLLVTIGVVR
jgi:L-fucose mutarotase